MKKLNNIHRNKQLAELLENVSGTEERNNLTEMWELTGNQPAVKPLTAKEKLDDWNSILKKIKNGTTDSPSLQNGYTKPAPVKSSGTESYSPLPAHTTGESNIQKIIEQERVFSETQHLLKEQIAPLRKATESRSKFHKFLYAAAAVLLIAIGTGFWFQLSPQYETFTAMPGETARITLADNSTVLLNSGSELLVPKGFGDNHRNLELNGEAFFEVAGASIPFMVTTSNAVVEVLGTSFNVRSWSHHKTSQTLVGLESGKVDIYSPARLESRSRLEPGQVVRIVGTTGLTNLEENIPISDITAWRNKDFAFNGTSLEDALDEIQRRFNVSVQLRQNAARSKQVTGFYRNPENPRLILDDLATITGLTLEEKNSSFWLY
ncbi:MAG: FecR domain-containing protein [Balneolales bacterium]|nr:FecR domain-containing protein [Balneolales bacterium]